MSIRGMRRPAAVVFDFDGLVVDTEWVEYVTIADMFRRSGAELSFELWQGFIGTTDHPHWTELLADALGQPVDRDALVAARTAEKDVLLAAEPILPGVVELLDELDAHAVPIGMASSSSSEWVRGNLERLGLLDRFEVIVTRDDVTAAKPSPELYLRACVGLAVEPTGAVALEDSLHGVTSARAAGMAVVAVPGRLTVGLDFSAASLVVGSLSDVGLDALGSLVGS